MSHEEAQRTSQFCSRPRVVHVRIVCRCGLQSPRGPRLYSLVILAVGHAEQLPGSSNERRLHGGPEAIPQEGPAEV